MPRQAVWAALLDPEVLRRCVPGCQSLEQVEPNRYAAKVALAVGPVKAAFDTTLKLTDLDAPNSYRLTGAGKGGAVGFGEGRCDVALAEDEGDATLLSYTADFQVGGRLAQLGSRLVLATTRKLAEEFFENLLDDLDAETERLGVPAPEQAKPGGRRRALLVVVITVAVLVALALWLGMSGSGG